MFAVGDDGAVTMVYCLTNVDRSSRSFTIDPAEHYHAWAHARSCGWDIGGIFHSHPESLPQPSPDDLVGLDPEWVSVIVSPAGVRAYRVRDGVPSEVFVERSPR